MTLSEAIEEVKLYTFIGEWTEEDVHFCDDDALPAIATILNAVVKGELRRDNDR